MNNHEQLVNPDKPVRGDHSRCSRVIPQTRFYESSNPPEGTALELPPAWSLLAAIFEKKRGFCPI